jgi:hypothetical protein
LCGGDGGSPYCASTKTDNANCGACGVACGTGLLCTNGACTNACAGQDGGAQTLCTPDAGAPYCTDTQTDNANCGACGTVCSNPATCSAGACNEPLTVTLAGGGSGTVTSQPSGISCGTTCAADFPLATVVTLTAKSDQGSTFTGWSGAGCSGTGTCVVTMNAAASVVATFACGGQQTFTYTGALVSFTVPSCAKQVTITAYGGAGGDSPGQTVGLGGSATGSLAVNGGDTLYVSVGKVGNDGSGDNPGVAGVYGGGGAGGSSIGGTSQPGGASGGGASDVRAGGQALSNRVIVAAGGGGAGGGTGNSTSNGGAAGGLTGTAGTSYAAGIGYEAQGGTQSAGGAAGSYNYSGMTGGTPGSLGQGGDGWGGGYSGGGGGGGGYYGGGGGSTHFESGGGGGSSYIGGVTSSATSGGVHTGDGSVTITW